MVHVTLSGHASRACTTLSDLLDHQKHLHSHCTAVDGNAGRGFETLKCPRAWCWLQTVLCRFCVCFEPLTWVGRQPGPLAQAEPATRKLRAAAPHCFIDYQQHLAGSGSRQHRRSKREFQIAGCTQTDVKFEVARESLPAHRVPAPQLVAHYKLTGSL